MLTKEEVSKIALLARLAVSEEEVPRYQQQLSAILDFVAQLGKVDLGDVPPLSHVHGISNVLREDVTEPSLSAEEVVAQAPDRNGRFFRVPLIVE